MFRGMYGLSPHPVRNKCRYFPSQLILSQRLHVGNVTLRTYNLLKEVETFRSNHIHLSELLLLALCYSNALIFLDSGNTTPMIRHDIRKFVGQNIYDALKEVVSRTVDRRK
ncbi:hypothetical protein TNCV_2898961 [Trichonephila clavipes]|nr:hypothetical protein TNCV_2898961 [Trichonephila clavipes]